MDEADRAGKQQQDAEYQNESLHGLKPYHRRREKRERGKAQKNSVEETVAVRKRANSEVGPYNS
ncbi:MAG: hypothetical protein NVS9B14_12120 [Candidatus Acidiferrum sp.]